MPSIRVLIADDHVVVLKGLRYLLGESEKFEVVGDARTGDEAVRKAAELKPDVVILDVKMPVKSGIDALREIRDVSPETHVVILSMYKSDHYMRAAFLGGASAYLTKDGDLSGLYDVLERVHEGDVIWPRGKQIGALLEKDPLTPREMQVLILIGNALSSKEIAAQLKIEPRTVDAHRQNIMRKLDLHTTAELVRFCYQNNLIDLD